MDQHFVDICHISYWKYQKNRPILTQCTCMCYSSIFLYIHSVFCGTLFNRIKSCMLMSPKGNQCGLQCRSPCTLSGLKAPSWNRPCIVWCTPVIVTLFTPLSPIRRQGQPFMSQVKDAIFSMDSLASALPLDSMTGPSITFIAD